jgi:pilus assembly protein Flp/PilA
MARVPHSFTIGLAPNTTMSKEKGQTMNKVQEFAIKAKNYMEVDERGAAGVEYGLLVALIAAVIIGTVAVLGTQINAAFTTITSAL